jgi:hypothetical protein
MLFTRLSIFASGVLVLGAAVAFYLNCSHRSESLAEPTTHINVLPHGSLPPKVDCTNLASEGHCD